MKYKNQCKALVLVLTAWAVLVGVWFVIYTLFSLS